jgi:integrase
MDPMASPEAKDFWRDRLREDLSGEQHQAAPLRKAMLKKLVAALEASTAPTRKVQHRLRQSVIDAQARRRLRDIAMLHVAYDLMTRSSELVALEWGRLSAGRRGGGTYRFGKTKTDQVGKGTECYLRPETMRALKRWQDASPVGGYIFHQVSDDLMLPLDKADDDKEREAWAQRKKRGEAKEMAMMSAREVGTVFRRACDVAGVDLSRTWLSGHSARVGAAQDMARADLSTVQIMLAGCWRSERMPFHYAAQLKAEQHGEERHRRVDAVEDNDEAD